MKDCLKCKNLDTSDIPNLFCNISCELVNETDFRYCPKDIKSVVAFIEKQDKQIRELQKELEKKNKLCHDIVKQNSEILPLLEKNTTKLKAYTKAFNLIEINGMLTDCIIEVTQDVEDNKVLALFEEVSNMFADKVVTVLQKLDKGE